MLSLHHSRPPASSAGALSPSSAPVLSGFAGEQNPVAAVSPHVAEKTIDETLIPEEEKAELVELVIGRNGNRIKAPIPPSMKSAINIRRLGPSGWELAKTTDFAGGMWLAFAEGEECRGYVYYVRPDKNGSFTIGVSTETALLPHVQLREDEILKDVPGVAIIQIKHNAPYASALLSAKRLSEKEQTALDLAFPSAFSNRERIAGLGNVDFIPQQTSKSQGKRRAHNDSDGREIAPGAPSPIVRFGEPIDVVPREDLTALHKCWESLKGKGSVTDDVFELVMEWRKYNENIYPALGQEDVYFFTPKETQFLARNPEPEFEAMHPDATPSKILEGITHPILAFPIKHINNEWTYTVHDRRTGISGFFDSIDHEDIFRSIEAEIALSNIYDKDYYARQNYPNRSAQHIFERKDVPQLGENNVSDSILHVLGGFAQMQDRRNGMNVNSRLEDAVPFDREILREHIALRMLCNAVNEGYPNLTPINHYECTYEFERYFANAKLRLFDKTKEPDKVEFEDPVGNPIMPPDVFIMEKLKIPIDYFKERVESRSASAKRSRTNDYTRSDVSGSDLIKMGGSAQSSSMIFSQQSSLPSEFRSNFGPGHSSRRQQFDPNIDPRLQPQETGNTQPPSPGLDGGESEFPFEDFLHLNPPLPKPGFGEQKSTARQSSPPNQWQDILDKSRTTTPDGQSRAKNPGMGSDNLAR